jgi:hypothetical protein
MLRLSTTDDHLFFQNNFQSDIVIEPNSQIALFNTNFDKDLDNTIITGDDNLVKVIITVNGVNSEIDIELPHKIYNINNIDVIYNYINNEIKRRLDMLSGNDSNLWQMGLTIEWEHDDATKILINRVPIVNLIEIFSANNNKFISLFGGGNYTLSATNNRIEQSNATIEAVMAVKNGWYFPLAIDAADMIDEQPFQGGCWIFSAEIEQLDATSTGGIMGLLLNGDKNRRSPNKFLDVLNYELCIEFKSTNNTYIIHAYKDDVQTPHDTGENPTVGDLLVIRLNTWVDPGNSDIYGNFMQVYLFNAGNANGKLLLQHGLTPKQDNVFVVPTFAWRPDPGASPLRFGDPHLCAPLYNTNLSTDQMPRNNITPSVGAVAANLNTHIGFQTNDDVTITFQISDTLAELLGFKETEISTSITGIVGQDGFIKSDLPVKVYDRSEAYVIELVNLPVDFQDGYLEQRKNVCMLFQNVRNRNEPDVYYQATYPVFLDLRNHTAINLRTLSARILNSNYVEVNNKGLANMTLLIKSSNER